MTDKKGFILYKDYVAIFEKLSMQERGELITAILQYVCEKESGTLTPTADIAFAIIRAQLERDNIKYRAKCAKRAEYGKKGGKAKSSKAKSSKSKQAQAKEADKDK